MSSSPIEIRPLARTVVVTDDDLSVSLADGRVITVPLVWFPRLLHADAASRSKWELLGDGEGVHWPDADEDLGVEGLLAGTRARGAA
ncbi:DUF2442 domain-containing protein [bacterium]|nr:DUF2442 domain-containing protein [bacterium]